MNWMLPSDMVKDSFCAKFSQGFNALLDSKILSKFSFLQIEHEDSVINRLELICNTKRNGTPKKHSYIY